VTLPGTDGARTSRHPRLVVLVDFDGTIARLDLSDEVMRRYADLDAWAPLEAAYLAGEIGSRTLLTRQAAILHGETGEIATVPATGAELATVWVSFTVALVPVLPSVA